ncbi:Hepatic lectin [Holothuria leucospilota]|uniref:Hepatic lectin n=1 Tax=Holothuria leucospilota TaxID=206669 RepID=A0A9Q1BYI1_HOLLE|nr:Hepatic lectin [Holothuria leucospilota]
MLARWLFVLLLCCVPFISIQVNGTPVCYSIDEGGKSQFIFRLVSCYKNVERITHRFQSKDDVSTKTFVQHVMMEKHNDDKDTTINDMTTMEYVNPSSPIMSLMPSITTGVTEARATTGSSSSFFTSTKGFTKVLQSTEFDQVTTVSIITTEQELSTDVSTPRQFSTPGPSTEATTDLSTSERITTRTVTQSDQTTTVSTTPPEQKLSTDVSTPRKFSTPGPSTGATTDPSTSERITTRSVTPCLNWIDYNQVSFCVSPEALSWYDAVENCRGYPNNGRLVYIDSEEKNKIIVEFRENEGSNFSWMWIGVNDMETEGVWKLEDNKTVDASLFFGDGEPNGNTDGKADQDCVFAIVVGEWRDYPCTEELHFICER